jgi:cytochrome c peroxidase
MKHHPISYFFVALSISLPGCGSKTTSKTEIDQEFLQNFKVAPVVMENGKNPLSEEKIALGRMLYYDERLSKSQTISCNSCHALDRYGVDNQPTSTGFKGQKGGRNAPTVYYAAGHVVQFWDGRAPDVEAQAMGPVMNPVEMAMADAHAVEAVLLSMPEYKTAFAKAFPNAKQPVTLDNAALAIAAFERKLVTPSRWDKFLAGDANALTPEEKAGFIAFYRAGCHTCHGGALVGGRLYQKVGLVKPWPDQKDLGRFDVTKQDSDKMVFKVPSLRNIDKTAPYFHDGSVSSLENAVRMMGEYQVERPLTDSEAKEIVTWLKSLTGELPADYIRKPELPKSTDKTPKPVAD